MYKILEKRVLNENVVFMKLSAPMISQKVKPGQFIILRIDEVGERIPLTVADFSNKEGTISIIFQTVGATTKRLATLNEDDCILDLVGPLGCPTEFGAPKKAIVVGGGVGCAIAYPQAKALYNMGVETTVIAGFRNKDIVILEDEMDAVSNSLYITTDDGSYGQ